MFLYYKYFEYFCKINHFSIYTYDKKTIIRHSYAWNNYQHRGSQKRK